MRVSRGLALAAVLAVACGGDDEPEPAQTPPVQRPTPQQRPEPPLDTTAADSPAAPAAAPDAEAGDREAAAPPDDRARSERLYTVQVAAFTERESAEEWTARLRRLDLPVWTSVAEIGGTTYYRVRIGATPRLGEAQRLGTVLSDRFEWPVWVAPVTPADRMPDDAVEDTRRVLGS